MGLFAATWNLSPSLAQDREPLIERFDCPGVRRFDVESTARTLLEKRQDELHELQGRVQLRCEADGAEVRVGDHVARSVRLMNSARRGRARELALLIVETLEAAPRSVRAPRPEPSTLSPPPDERVVRAFRVGLLPGLWLDTNGALGPGGTASIELSQGSWSLAGDFVLHMAEVSGRSGSVESRRTTGALRVAFRWLQAAGVAVSSGVGARVGEVYVEGQADISNVESTDFRFLLLGPIAWSEAAWPTDGLIQVRLEAEVGVPIRGGGTRPAEQGTVDLSGPWGRLALGVGFRLASGD